jgi:hypothetical protein
MPPTKTSAPATPGFTYDERGIEIPLAASRWLAPGWSRVDAATGPGGRMRLARYDLVIGGFHRGLVSYNAKRGQWWGCAEQPGRWHPNADRAMRAVEAEFWAASGKRAA